MMMAENDRNLSIDDVRHIASLCRIGMTDEELERMSAELSDLVGEVAYVQSIDTSRVGPMGHAADSIDTVMRDDESSPPLSVGDVLANAPRREGDYFRVRAILD